MSEGLDLEDAHYSVYRNPPFTTQPDSFCVLGVTKPAGGSDRGGFVVEMAGSMFVRGEAIPNGLAARGRELEMHSKSQSVPIAELAIRAEKKRLSEELE